MDAAWIAALIVFWVALVELVAGLSRLETRKGGRS
jgi:hypothetical protein